MGTSSLTYGVLWVDEGIVDGDDIDVAVLDTGEGQSVSVHNRRHRHRQTAVGVNLRIAKDLEAKRGDVRG